MTVQLVTPETVTLIRHGFHATPLGACFIATTERGVCALEFIGSSRGRAGSLARLRKNWPAARLVSDPRATASVAKRVFRRKTSVAKPLPVLVRGTNFQVRVWRALLSVPAGRTVSYSELARMSGYPRAVRAVGSAMGANRIAYLIPCHRVVRSDGQLGQYAWGTARKAAALAFDASLQ
jgi:AraC family transcriptional regulator, regulatory protein of adaptative response / methylated-DNA-[protein]-cysteine methyltransferase